MRIGKDFYAGRLLWLEAILQHGSKQYARKTVVRDIVCVNDFVDIACTNYIEIVNGMLIASVFLSLTTIQGTYTKGATYDECEFSSRARYAPGIGTKP